MNASTHTARHPGLDTLRALAILLVLMYHYMVVVTGTETFGFLTRIGWTGVDLFFVLSGYLIGNQIVGGAERPGWRLGTFMARRLLRTLPNYFVVLAAYWAFPAAIGGAVTASAVQFLTFTQNFDMHPGETFTHSWSLCVEEQFYLVLPLVALAIARLRARARAWWLLLAATVLACVAVRTLAWLGHGHEAITSRDYYEHIYYTSFARFDELLAGVAVAVIRHKHPALWRMVLGWGNKLLVTGVAAVGVMWWWLGSDLQVDGFGYPLAPTAIGYSLMACAYAVLVLAALSPSSLLNRVRVPGAQCIAVWSYSLYLAHKPIYKLMMKPLTQFGIDTGSAAGVLIILAVSFAGGWLLYRCVERPFLGLRDARFSASPGAATA